MKSLENFAYICNKKICGLGWDPLVNSDFVVHVQLLNGNTRKMVVHKTMSFMSLKEDIASNIAGVGLLSTIRLSYNGKNCQDEVTLDEACVMDRSTLVLSLKLEGGMSVC